jgi:hypothetical protein
VTADALDRGGWGSTVVVGSDEVLRRSLIERHEAGPTPGSISVTEVLDPRPAYWRRVHPVPATPERAQRMRAGQEMHVLAGHLLAPSSAREVRRRRDGIVARVDLLDDRVTELKTTALRNTVDRSSVRPVYLQQLAVYCALLERNGGRLIMIDPNADPSPRVATFDAEFGSGEVAWAEARRRSEMLRTALERQSPSGLPRCPWRDRGCEFQSAGVCDCTGGEPEAAPEAFGPLPEVEPREDVADRLSIALAGRPTAPGVRRFRDLLYPRRAFFERTVPTEEGEREWSPGPTGRTEDLWRQISDLLETGTAGELGAVDPTDGEPLERVTTLAGRPLVLKTTRSSTPPAPERVLTAQPQYVLELGLRCSTTGASRGTLIVGYERILPWERRIQAYDISFEPVSAIGQVAQGRIQGLKGALGSGSPAALPPCPSWMYEGCPYRPGCACVAGAGPGVDQR